MSQNRMSYLALAVFIVIASGNAVAQSPLDDIHKQMQLRNSPGQGIPALKETPIQKNWNEILRSVAPTELPEISYKSIYLGKPYQMNDEESFLLKVSSNPEDVELKSLRMQVPLSYNSNAKFSCVAIIFVNCEINKTTQDRNFDTEALKTAFGRPVHFSMSLVPDDPIIVPLVSGTQLNARVAAITIENRATDDEFVETAIRHFAEKLGAPKLLTGGQKDAIALESPECQKAEERIKALPRSAVSLRDKEILSGCVIDSIKRYKYNKANYESPLWFWMLSEGRATVSISYDPDERFSKIEFLWLPAVLFSRKASEAVMSMVRGQAHQSKEADF